MRAVTSPGVSVRCCGRRFGPKSQHQVKRRGATLDLSVSSPVASTVAAAPALQEGQYLSQFEDAVARARAERQGKRLRQPRDSKMPHRLGPA